MKILLDECIPRKFRRSFPGHDSETVPGPGFAGKKSELLPLAERAGFEVFLTIDQGIEFQQNLAGRNIAILILRAKSNQLDDLLPLVDDCSHKMLGIRPGQVLKVG